MEIECFGGAPPSCSTYLIYAKGSGEAAVIDATLGCTKPITQVAGRAQVTVRYVISTHGHWNNIAENVSLCRATGAELCGHAWDSARFAEPGITSDDSLAQLVPGKRPDHFVGDDEVLQVGGLELEIWHTPGHSPGSICIYIASEGVVFTGDTLLSMQVGTSDRPGGNRGQLLKSLQRLGQLPNATRVYPGLGMPTTIKAERWLLELVTLELANDC